MPDLKFSRCWILRVSSHSRHKMPKVHSTLLSYILHPSISLIILQWSSSVFWISYLFFQFLGPSKTRTLQWLDLNNVWSSSKWMQIKFCIGCSHSSDDQPEIRKYISALYSFYTPLKLFWCYCIVVVSTVVWFFQRFNGRLSTRSDEDGFGGIYGGNQKLSKEEEDKGGNEKHTGMVLWRWTYPQGSHA